MKIKTTILAITSALYAASIAANVQASGSLPQAVDMMKLHNLQKQLAAQTNSEFLSPLRHGSLSNVQFTPKSVSDKIKLEKDLTGAHTYIVRLLDQPVATYDGNITGLQATKASVLSNRKSNNVKLFSASKAVGAPQAAVDAYTKHLLNKQQHFVDKATNKGLPLDVRQQFTTAINAITVNVTQAQALKLAEMSEVAYVQRSKVYQLHSDVGPEHVGAGGVWNGSGTTEGGSYKGEGMLVGIIDTGINTQHPSFAPVDGDGYEHTNPLGSGNFLGDCATDDFAERCNDKLIGVYTHPTVTDTFFSIPPNDWTPAERLAPEFGEDFNGHGSHVASTVAGNTLYEVDDLLPDLVGDGHGQPVGVKMPKVSGVAPRANIISYQVCMPTGGCGGEAMLFAIEQAIKDGVDVINMSIGGGESFPWDNAFEMAFLSAREAGVAVALSAGNSGAAYGTDSLYTVDHTSPWVLNVAATTHARSIKIDGKELANFNGGDSALTPLTLKGAGISGEFTGEFVLAADYGDARCNSPFAADTFSANQIVVCERGDIARFQKAVNVQLGGGGAFVLYNTSLEGDQVNDDPYVIPGIHISNAQWEGPSWKIKALKPWLASGTGLTGTITASEVSREINDEDADWLAVFSSRGPSSTVDELFSPGIAAPGVDIFAAWTEENPFEEFSDTRDWNRISGTSMASPHVAGVMTLVRQAHPEWSASEVQSALQMSADSKAIKMQHPYYDEVVVAGPYRAGHGLINVARAIDSGLVMDETAENFRRANPHNGGRVRDLNLPQLINRDCGRVCSWTRTVKATQDGTWNVNVEKLQQNHMSYDWTLDPTAKMTVLPSTFTLKAGESITLTINSSFNEVDSAWYDGTIHADQGEIQFIAEDEAMPMAIWPYSSLYTGKTLPNTVNIMATDDNASAFVANVPFGVPAAAINAVAYAPVQLSNDELALSRQGFNDQLFNVAGYFNIQDDAELNTVKADFIATIPVTVAENSAIFTAELTGVSATTSKEFSTNSYINADIYIVKDFNGDGKLHFTEAICGSFLPQTTKGEFCTIENPEAGDYTIIVANGLMYPWESIDTISVSYGVVSKQVSNEFSFEFNQSADDELTSDMNISWNKELAANSIYHSAIAVQAGDNEQGSLTFIPMKITRGANTVSITASQTDARVGDVVDMSVMVQANRSGSDRMVNLQAQLTDGLTIVPGSINAVEGLTLNENGFSINAEQINSADWATNYELSTNETDAMCRTPWDEYLPEVDGGYIDLRAYGLVPSWGSFFEVNEWGWGNWVHELTIPVLTDSSTTLAPFDNEAYFETNQMVLSSRGWVQLDMGNYNPWDIVPQQIHLELPFTGYSTPPDYLFAPLWNATQDNNWNQSMTLAKYGADSGVTMAYLGDYVLLEWDNAKTHDKGTDLNWNTTFDARDDSYDHQMFMRSNTSNVPGKYEVVMAYNNVDFGTQTGSGSIGVRGYNGPRAGFWPLNGHTGVSAAYNNLDDVIKDGLVICYDIKGPESTAIMVNFKAQVTRAAISTTQSIAINGSVDGTSEITEQADIVVASNINITAIADQSIAENTSLENIMVSYSDSDGGISANTITVTGDNIVAAVNEHTSGSVIAITPETNWHGTTQVTVTVTDNIFGNDLAATKFMLSVVSDDIDLGCIDSTANNFDATANTDDGSCTYPANEEGEGEEQTILGCMDTTATNFVASANSDDGSCTYADPIVEPTEKSSGGSMGWLALTLLPVVLLRRKKLTLAK
ncbi:S8 family serine peptidase [Thalassotalea fonticola]|uniref:S8 family serine peptidase n=1 Tax=Thalassotalea fonticola TaxID=3065649 RepID=A0ABZ0GPZ9_9GAMM|nr:S8 family serine peptidase [Colwelliaceae bacterium S1-1]